MSHKCLSIIALSIIIGSLEAYGWVEDKLCQGLEETGCKKKNTCFWSSKPRCLMKDKKIKTCEEIKIPSSCESESFSYLNCIWVGAPGTGKCLSKSSSLKCSDLDNTACSDKKYSHLNCYLEEKTKKCIVRPKDPCLGASKIPCKLRFRSCTWFESQKMCGEKLNCPTENYTQCTSPLGKDAGCSWVGTPTDGKCLLKSSVKCGELKLESDCTEVYKSLKCAWTEDPITKIGKCQKSSSGFSP
jgi:hypothetical protein